MIRLGGISRAALVLVVIVVMVSGSLPPFAAAQDPNAVVSQRIALQAASSAETYWTPERMAAAQPLPLPLRTPTLGPAGIQARAVPSGLRVIASSGGPGDVPQEERRELTAQEVTELTQDSKRRFAEGAIEPLAGAFPFTFTSYRLFPLGGRGGLNRVFPYKLTGKLFFTIPGSGNFVCTGSIINAPNLSVVWTTGHCVFTPGVGFHTNFLFSPGRDAGTNPFRTWTARTVATLTGWAASGLFEYDHGGLVMNLSRGRAIGTNVGFLGFIANIAREQHWHVHGYPAAFPFDGEHHHICTAAHAVDDQPTGTPGVDPETIGIGCDMTPGVSGSPFVIDFSGVAGATNMVNGNASYRYVGFPDELYGPYFGAGAVALRDFLSGL